MERKRVVVLANSIKRGARCVAGIEVRAGEAFEPAGWIRPVSGESHGELEPRHMAVADGGHVAPLDIVDVPLAEYANDPAHPEDWIVSAGLPWQRSGKLGPRTLATLREFPDDLWLDPAAPVDRVRSAYVARQQRFQSLYLIRPERLRIRLSREIDEAGGFTQKRRAIFGYRGEEYDLGLTDPVVTEKYWFTFPNPGQPANEFPFPYADRCLVCVSLTPMFLGCHYKVVASVLELL
jgi:hypothetical protein